MKTPIYNRSKKVWNNEQEALTDVLAKQKLSPGQLEAAHTEKNFSWKLKNQDATIENNPFSVKKTKGLNLNDATHLAMEHFDTFGGNIKRNEELESATHYVFEKVR